MNHLAIQTACRPPPLREGLIRMRSIRKTATYVNAFKKDGKSGIHDPSGPGGGSWGDGERKARQEKIAQEESFRVGKDDLTRKDIRSDQKIGNHPPGHSAVDRPAAVSKEMEEMADEKADEEYAHLSKTQKKLMELKNALYNYLKTGYEPPL